MESQSWWVCVLECACSSRLVLSARGGPGAGAIVGAACGIASWLACTQIMSGSITVDTAGLNPPLLTGSILSMGVSAILVPVISLIAPCKPFDWEELNTRITTTEDVVRGRLFGSLDTVNLTHCLPQGAGRPACGLPRAALWPSWQGTFRMRIMELDTKCRRTTGYPSP